MKRKKIMVIDDDKEFLSEIKQLLDSSGYKTITLSDIKNITGRVVKTKPDLILLDIKLTGKSGLDVFYRLKKSVKTSRIPVIAVTGIYKDSNNAELFRIYGMDDFISKPFEPSELIKKIEYYMERQRIEKEIKEIDKIEESLNFVI